MCGWSPATFADDYRKRPNVEAVHLLGLDDDESDELPAIDHEHVRQHDFNGGWRAFVRLSPSDRRRIRRRVVDGEEAHPDARRQREGREPLRYSPIHRPGEPYTCTTIDGPVIDVDRVLAMVPPKLPPPPRSKPRVRRPGFTHRSSVRVAISRRCRPRFNISAEATQRSGSRSSSLANGMAWSSTTSMRSICSVNTTSAASLGGPRRSCSTIREREESESTPCVWMKKRKRPIMTTSRSSNSAAPSTSSRTRKSPSTSARRWASRRPHEARGSSGTRIPRSRGLVSTSRSLSRRTKRPHGAARSRSIVTGRCFGSITRWAPSLRSCGSNIPVGQISTRPS